jgi:hypothetical protein
LVGSVEAIATLKQMAYKTTILGGRVDLGDRGIRVVGLLWLLAAAAFVAAAGAFVFQAPWALPFTLALSGTPLLLCAIEWPEARIGVFVNIGLLLVLLLASWLGPPIQPGH